MVAPLGRFTETVDLRRISVDFSELYGGQSIDMDTCGDSTQI